jgi:hypothetical protein
MLWVPEILALEYRRLWPPEGEATVPPCSSRCLVRNEGLPPGEESTAFPDTAYSG